MLFGLALAAPLAALAGAQGLDGPAIGWLAIVGVGNAAGLGFAYAGFLRANVAVVAALASTQGALAAVIAIAAGERLSALTLAGMAPLVMGVLLVAVPPRAAFPTGRAGVGPSIALGMTAATLFAASLYAAGRAGEDLPAAWVALPARVAGTAGVVLLLAAGMRPLVHPGRARLALGAGAAEVVGVISFTIGAREQIAVTAVLGSQFAALTAIGGLLFYGERLHRRQVVGVGILAVGVALVALGAAG